MKKYPAFFFGHGNPMNAILDNSFSRTWHEIGRSLKAPQAIVSISAHFETQGTYITALDTPRTIYDFSGFPKELYDVKYPLQGSQKLAQEIIKQVPEFEIIPDYSWGIDHGTWTILHHLFPQIGNIPVLQLSLDISKTPQEHFALGKALAKLREQDILVMGSGDIVHNLFMLDWDHENKAYQWAQEVNQEVKEMLLRGDIENLLSFRKLGPKYEMAIPTKEHFLPLLYMYAMKGSEEKIEFFNDTIVNGSLSMTSFVIQ